MVCGSLKRVVSGRSVSTPFSYRTSLYSHSRGDTRDLVETKMTEPSALTEQRLAVARMEVTSSGALAAALFSGAVQRLGV